MGKPYVNLEVRVGDRWTPIWGWGLGRPEGYEEWFDYVKILREIREGEPRCYAWLPRVGTQVVELGGVLKEDDNWRWHYFLCRRGYVVKFMELEEKPRYWAVCRVISAEEVPDWIWQELLGRKR